MPFRPHYRVTALGRLGSSGERFSYGLNMAPGGGAGTAGGAGDTITWDQTAWADVAEDVRTFHATPGTHICARAVLEVVKVARINAEGKYDDIDALAFDVQDTPGGIGGADQPYILPQSALAVSLVTARRGPSGKGRFYIPMPSANLAQADLLNSLPITEAIQTSTVALINNMNNAPGLDAADIKVCVASTKGFNTPVTAIRVGRVVDTIRTRRRSIPESYVPPVAVS